MLTEAEILEFIRHLITDTEGGYVNDPDDPGGETNFGITQITADVYGLGRVSTLTFSDAVLAYRKMFADWKIDKITNYVLFKLIVDSCVNHGSHNTIRWLQNSLGLKRDGILGNETLGALDKAKYEDIVYTYTFIIAERMHLYGSMIGSDAKKSKFARGWLERLSRFISPWPLL